MRGEEHCMRLADKIALITGSGQGIGRAVALRMAEEGADLVLNDVDGVALEEVAAQVRGLGRRALAVRADVTRAEEVERMVEEAIATFGRIDILVNNAGGSRGPYRLEEITEANFDEVLNLNLKSTFLCTRAVVPHMKRQGGGRIVNVASVAGRSRSIIGGPQYAAAKAGVIGFTRHLAGDLAPFNINVNAVAPGVTLSERVAGRWLERPEEYRQEVLRRIPMGRLATVEEQVGGIVFLCTDDARYITGATLDINGGLFIG